MNIIKNNSIEWLKGYGIDIQRLTEKLGSNIATPPVGLMLCKVKPQESAHLHQHEDKEMFIVLQGKAIVSNGVEEQHLDQHDLTYFPSEEQHTIKNISTTDELIYLSIYWIEG